ncbi:dehydrogenase [Salegentibacter salinarum]|uniref:Dehydrogenase n=2 Tax=Salegentibacter salinarum TaxID=447422 RepID=A0A2N0TML6_9FLAO|nr:dehydrogenase [Salegentibacter salinarum]
MQDPQKKYPQPPYSDDKQEEPGVEKKMNPMVDHGEESYRGSGKLEGKNAIITGGDSGIGRAVAIAFAREGANVLISYLEEHEDARETEKYIKEAGKEAVLMAGDVSEESHCKEIIKKALEEFGQIDILVNNAAFQMARESLQDISSEEWDYTFKTNIYSMFYLCKEAVPNMKPGATIINTSSINAYSPHPKLLAYAATKGAIQNYTANLAQILAEKGIRVNCVAPGPIWTPLIPATMPQEKVEKFGKNTPLGRAGQPAELAASYVLLASEDSSYTTGSTVQITGGRPTI